METTAPGYGWRYDTEHQSRLPMAAADRMTAPFQTRSYSIPGITPEDPFAEVLSEEGRFQRKTGDTTGHVFFSWSGMRASLWSKGNAEEAPGQWQVLQSSWLEDALAALREVDDEIAEEALPVIKDAVKVEAERLIKALAGHPWAPAVYPTQDGEVAIHFKSQELPNSVVILLNNGGEAECYAHTGSKSRRAHYDASSDLPDAFVLQQLRALMPKQSNSPVRSGGIGLPWVLLARHLPPTW